MKIGCARVSTKHQRESLDGQIALVKKAGCKEIYSEVISGSNAKRPELTKLLTKVQSGENGILIQKQDGSKRKGSKLVEQLSGRSMLNMTTEYIMKLTRS